MIELTYETGRKIYLNRRHIISIERTLYDATHIRTNDGWVHAVTETPNEILALFPADTNV